jgi:replicative DNA helicase
MDNHVPPSAVAIEEKILGACLLDEQALEKALENQLSASDFYERQNRILFSAILDLSNAGKSHDAITTIQYLTDIEDIENAGGGDRILHLASGLLPISAVPSWARIVIEKSKRRKLIRQLIEAHEEIYNAEIDVDEVMRSLETQFDSLRRNVSSEDTAHDFVNMVREFIPQRLNPEPEKIVYPLMTGISAWDNMIRLKKGELMIIGGRPSMGKTQFAFFLMRKQLERYKRVVFFSAEMKAEQIRDRGIASYTNVNLTDITGNHVLDAEKQQALAHFLTGLDDLGLGVGDFTIDDKSGYAVTLKYIRERLHKIIKTYGEVDLVVLDYLQLCTKSSGDQDEGRRELNALVTGCKHIATELNVKFIALSQLNRNPESRSNKRPIMSDFSESGKIEQDADYALLLYRDAYYNPETNEPNVLEVITAKNRNGPTGTIKLGSILATGNYHEL